MIRALEIGQEPDKVHLKECGECRRLVDFLARIDVSRRRPLEGASEELIGRAALIPLLTGSNRPRRVIAGTVVFDSWSQLPAVQVRDNAKGMERRLRLKAGDVTAELVAEHQPDTWEFTARVY